MTLKPTLFCRTDLPLARTRWVWLTFLRHCPLSSNQRCWLTRSIISPLKFYWEPWNSNPGTLGEKQVCYLCAMQPHQHFRRGPVVPYIMELSIGLVSTEWGCQVPSLIVFRLAEHNNKVKWTLSASGVRISQNKILSGEQGIFIDIGQNFDWLSGQSRSLESLSMNDSSRMQIVRLNNF